MFRQKSAQNKADGREPQCGICYEPVFIREQHCVLLPCKHWYHEDCLGVWLNHAEIYVCPYCRKSILDVDDDEDIKFILDSIIIKIGMHYRTIDLDTQYITSLLCDLEKTTPYYIKREIKDMLNVVPQQLEESMRKRLTNLMERKYFKKIGNVYEYLP